MQYSFDTLKEAIEFLAQQQADMSDRFDDLNDKFNGLPAPGTHTSTAVALKPASATVRSEKEITAPA